MAKVKNQGFIDRAIAAVAPVTGLRRMQARIKTTALMNYDAASFGRRLNGWKTPSTDADAASEYGRSRMRNLSRDMIRNAPFARRAQSVVTNNVVGLGITPSLTAKTEKARKAGKPVLDHMLSTGIDAYGEQNILGLQTTVMNAVFESGEILAVRIMKSGPNDLNLPFQIKLLEADYLDQFITSYGKNEVRDGVEYNGDGAIVAYHIYYDHPGSSSIKLKLKSQRWPASEVLHMRRVDRAGQLRGVPWLAPVMLTLGELRDYQEAQIVKQKMSALLALIIENDGDLVDGQLGLEALSPGAIVHATSGQKVTPVNPPSVDDYDPVMRLGLTAIAMGIGITAESLSGDLSRVNFSSGRMGRMEMDKNIETWQARILIEQFCVGVARWSWDALRFKNTDPGSNAGLSLTWTPPRRALIDPTKEIPAMIKQVEKGVTSLQRVQRGLGLDPETIRKEREEDERLGNGVTVDPIEKKPLAKTGEKNEG
ncbi:MAG: phage portal protein [Robiginitomaculum sp.]|nr:MAG: phage portal protein [Robiginitomaculum sp.]